MTFSFSPPAGLCFHALMDTKKGLLLTWFCLPEVEGGESQILPLDDDKQVMILLRFIPHGSICSKYKIQNRKLKRLFLNIPYIFCQPREFPSGRWEPPAQAAVHQNLTITELKCFEPQTSIKPHGGFKGMMCSFLPTYLARDQATQTPGPRCSCHAGYGSATEEGEAAGACS